MCSGAGTTTKVSVKGRDGVTIKMPIKDAVAMTKAELEAARAKELEAGKAKAAEADKKRAASSNFENIKIPEKVQKKIDAFIKRAEAKSEKNRSWWKESASRRFDENGKMLTVDGNVLQSTNYYKVLYTAFGELSPTDYLGLKNYANYSTLRGVSYYEPGKGGHYRSLSIIKGDNFNAKGFVDGPLKKISDYEKEFKAKNTEIHWKYLRASTREEQSMKMHEENKNWENFRDKSEAVLSSKENQRKYGYKWTRTNNVK